MKERILNFLIHGFRFYKIADKTSHPHYLSWALIEHPEPHFHLPEYFGTIVFE
ncbi:carbohydrate-binding family 9-like protein [Fodinibius roseus]|uniref:carbohydrate-binding family 9-like protein n=1 Tax=Fodinibius roseus TaxID=1194090 RepID=UPI000A037A7C